MLAAGAGGTAYEAATRGSSVFSDWLFYTSAGAGVAGPVGGILAWPGVFSGANKPFPWDEAYDAIIEYNRKLDGGSQAR